MSLAAPRLDVRSNIASVLADFRAERENINTATLRGLNRAVDSAATESSREIRKVYNLKDRVVKAAMRKFRASKNRLFAQLRIEGARIGLIDFEARWRPGQPVGATVKIKVKGGRRAIAGAFIGKAPRGGMGVFQRVGKRRYPLRYLSSISVPEAFSNDTVVKAVQEIAVVAFDKAFEQQIVYLRRLNG